MCSERRVLSRESLVRPVGFVRVMNQRRSLPNFPMNKVLILFLLALSACTSEVTVTVDTSCVIDATVARVADVCLSEQFVVMRCGSPISNPGECVPPKGADGVTPPAGSTESATWCCK